MGRKEEGGREIGKGKGKGRGIRTPLRIGLVTGLAMHPAIIIGTVRSLIVDVAMGQIPRSTERISSWQWLQCRCTDDCCER